MQCVPFDIGRTKDFPTIDVWRAAASGLVDEQLERWRLRGGGALTGGISGSVLEVTTEDGAPAVLKVGFPHAEGAWEAVGLEALGAELAPAVMAQDATNWALLLERVSPGLPLSRDDSLSPADAIMSGVALWRRIGETAVPDGVPTLERAMADYTRDARERIPAQRDQLDSLDVLRIVENAVDDLDALASSTAEKRLLHGDFNPGNILRSGATWRTIDTKPLVGDSAFDLWPLLSQIGGPFRQPDGAATLRGNLAAAASVADFDTDRVVRWAIGRSALSVTWYLHDGNPGIAAAEARALREWARLAPL